MTLSNSDPIAGFRDAISEAGIPVPELIIADGELHRFCTNGKVRDRSGWYVLHLDGIPAGAFGCWRTGQEQKWHARSTRKVTLAERREHRRRVRAMKQRRDEEATRRHEAAAATARNILDSTKPATNHPYLKKKGIKAHGVRCADGELIVPVYDAKGQIRSLQFITNDGDKKFLRGGQVQGGYYPIGNLGDVLYVCEGFATAASAHEATGAAVAVAFNAGNLKRVAETMRARHGTLKIVIVADNDVRTDGSENTGIAKATEAATAVGAMLAVPEMDGGECDFNDLYKACGPDVVRKCLEAATKIETTIAKANMEELAVLVLKDRGNQPVDTEKKSAATTLVEMALEAYDFGISPTGETYALPKSGPKIVSMLRGSKTSLRGQLARTYFRRYGRAAPQQALADALLVTEGMAQESEPVALYFRVASREGELWLDIGDATGRAVHITGDGWSVDNTVPMLFKRTILNGPLPDPVSGGDLTELWSLLNVTETDRPLLAAWLIAALFDDIPHPVLGIFGEQGTGKTTAQKMIVMAIDPGPVPTRKPPRDAESWVTAAAGSWMVGLDNLSDVSPWLSDSICRAVTGDGDVRRKLYTDSEYSVFAFRRCICLNGIDLGATRADLAERMLPINLERISESRRLTEDVLWPLWHRNHPRILGAILDLASRVLSVLPSVELASKPRMADFARIVAAVDAVTGSSGLKHYLAKQESLAADSLTGDPFILAVMELQYFEGTSAELLQRVAPEKPPRGWPRSPRMVTTRLRRHAPAMARTGWKIFNDNGQNHDKVVCWSVAPPEISSISDTQDPRIRSGSKSYGSRDGDPQTARTQIVEKPKETVSAGNAGHEIDKSQDKCRHCAGEGCRSCKNRPAAEIS